MFERQKSIIHVCKVDYKTCNNKLMSFSLPHVYKSHFRFTFSFNLFATKNSALLFLERLFNDLRPLLRSAPRSLFNASAQRVTETHLSLPPQIRSSRPRSYNFLNYRRDDYFRLMKVAFRTALTELRLREIYFLISAE